MKKETPLKILSAKDESRGKELADRLLTDGELTLRRGPDLAALREAARYQVTVSLPGDSWQAVANRASDQAFDKGYEAGVKAERERLAKLLKEIVSEVKP